MWDTIKKQLINKFINEIKSKETFEVIKEHLNDDFVEKFIIGPILKKISNHLNKYLLLFIGVNILILLLVLTNIIITIYHK